MTLTWNDITVSLASRFGWIAWIILAVAIVSAWLIYRRQTPGLGLILIRISIIVLVWLLLAWEPMLSYRGHEELPSRVLVAVDASKSMDANARSRHVEDLFASGWLDRLKHRHAVEKLDFGDATATNLNVPLQKAEAMLDESLLSVVLISDGQHNQGPSPLSLAREMRKREVRIYPLLLPESKLLPDAAIVQITGPSQAFKETDIPFEVHVRITGLPTQEIAVELGEQKSTIVHDGQDRLHVLPFQARFETPGVHVLEARVKPALPQPVEITTANNRASTTIRIHDDKAHVLIVDGEARWEHHYLAAALGRDPALQVERVLFVQPRIGIVKEELLEKMKHPSLVFPKVEPLDPLRKFDCILLGDVGPDHLGVEERKRLRKYVAAEGGTLVIQAGKRAMPMEWAALSDDPFAEMLPVGLPQALSPAQGFALEMTPLGQSTSFLQLDPDPAANAKIWSEMPRHFWGATGAAKPGARVLASAEPGDRPIILEQSFGLGKVLYLGLDSTWRWRYKIGDTWHHRFWGQVVRWASADRMLPAGNDVVRFGSRQAVVERDSPVTVVARFSDELPPNSKPTARVIREGDSDKGASVPLRTVRGGLWEAEFRELPLGKYRIELDVPGKVVKNADHSPGRGDVFTVVPASDRDSVDLSANVELLGALARESGGQTYAWDDAEQLVKDLDRRIVRREKTYALRIGSDPPAVGWVWALLIGLLTLEWIVRRRRGMA